MFAFSMQSLLALTVVCTLFQKLNGTERRLFGRRKTKNVIVSRRRTHTLNLLKYCCLSSFLSANFGWLVICFVFCHFCSQQLFARHTFGFNVTKYARISCRTNSNREKKRNALANDLNQPMHNRQHAFLRLKCCKYPILCIRCCYMCILLLSSLESLVKFKNVNFRRCHISS